MVQETYLDTEEGKWIAQSRRSAEPVAEEEWRHCLVPPHQTPIERDVQHFQQRGLHHLPNAAIAAYRNLKIG